MSKEDDQKVKVVSDGRWSFTHVTIGGREFRVSDLNIRLNRNTYALELEVKAIMPELDLEFLEKDTTVKIVDARKS